MTLINLVDLLVDMLVGISCCNMLVDIYDIYSNMLHGTIEHNMLWSKCLLPKMAESRVHMGARYIFCKQKTCCKSASEGSTLESGNVC